MQLHEVRLLWYKRFSTMLEEMGFELNPYHANVANIIINRKQIAICWYVGNNKQSHLDASMLVDMINEIEMKVGMLALTNKHEHKFVCMDITLNGNINNAIRITQYMQQALNMLKNDQ